MKTFREEIFAGVVRQLVLSVLLSVVLSLSCRPVCESTMFEIYGKPFGLQNIVPPDPDSIKKQGFHATARSCAIFKMFEKVANQVGTKINDSELYKTVIIIVNTTSRHELFITEDKTVLTRDTKFIVEPAIINDVLKEIINLGGYAEEPAQKKKEREELRRSFEAETEKAKSQ